MTELSLILLRSYALSAELLSDIVPYTRKLCVAIAEEFCMLDRLMRGARSAIVIAQQEAGARGHRFIGLEHLLIGLSHPDAGPSALALENLGFSTGDLRKELTRLAGSGPDPASQTKAVSTTPEASGVLKAAAQIADELAREGVSSGYILFALAGMLEASSGGKAPSRGLFGRGRLAQQPARALIERHATCLQVRWHAFEESFPDPTPVPDRFPFYPDGDSLVVRVTARLRRVAGGEITAMLELQADTDFVELAKRLAPDDDLVKHVHLFGYLCWYRYIARPSEVSVPSLQTAIDVLIPCFILGLSPLPVALLPALADRVAPAAARLLARAPGSGEPNSIDDVPGFTLDDLPDLWLRIVETSEADDDRLAGYLSNLGVALRQRYQRTGEPEDGVEAVAVLRRAVSLAEGENPERGTYLTNLSRALLQLADYDDDPDLLSESAEATRTALAALPADDQRSCGYQSVLCQALYELSQRMTAAGLGFNSREVLAEALSAGRAAVAATPRSPEEEAEAQSILSQALVAQVQLTRDMPLLNEAVAAGMAAVAALPEGHPQRPDYQVRLSDAMRVGPALLGAHLVPGPALDALRAAVAEARDDDPERAWYLTKLSQALQAVYDEWEDPRQLDEAADLARAALAAFPASGDAGRPLALLSLARTLRAHFEVTGDQREAMAARDLFMRVAESPTAPAGLSVDAWRGVAWIGTMTGQHLDALDALESAVTRLPRLISWGLRRQDRESQIAEAAGLGGQIVAAALAAGQPQRAVELLEQARGLRLTQVMDAREGLARLRAQAPDLAAEFADLVDVFDSLDAEQDPRTGPVLLSLGPAGDSGASPLLNAVHQVTQWRRRADTRFDALLTEIRARPGFAGFLLPPRFGQLQVQAAPGPIVIVNAAESRGDALIVTSDPGTPVRTVSLPSLTEQVAYDLANRFRPAVRDGAEDQIYDVLEWLWDGVAAPVMDALALAGPQDTDPGTWPRLWWCPVGGMSFLPLHAAGYHRDASGRTILDRVISSYTTNIRTLAYARRPRVPASGTTRPLIVALPETPGALDIPGVRSEVLMLRRLLVDALVLEGTAATHDAVVDALPAHRVAHFACHGVSDWRDPGRSRLLLYDHDSKPLTIAALSALDLSDAEFAYLSACSTTDIGTHLLDEAMHITAAFQLAGYRHVIGSLWAVSDRAASQIASSVYARLSEDGTAPADAAGAALALHLAVRRLRSDYKAGPRLWAPFIHVGP
jgi:hypothetical protein